MQMVNEKLTV